jgi:AbrB family looped-hinge helix DNA binding protein
MHYQSSMTSKGQVTVPKDIRDALGLAPGQGVEFELDADGHARIYKAGSAERVAARKAEIMDRLREVQAEFRGVDMITGTEMDGLAYQRWLRGDEFGE